MDIEILTYNEFLEKYDNIYGVIEDYKENDPVGVPIYERDQSGGYWTFKKIEKKNISKKAYKKL